MNRRKGQNGAVVISGSWYRVRWRLDVEGQEKRINTNEMSELYSRMEFELERRLAEAENIVVGFKVPASEIDPNAPRFRTNRLSNWLQL